MTERGKFIVLEGNDGAGKTTLAAKLANYMESLGMQVYLTREPGGMEETKPIRKLVLDPRLKDDPLAQLYGFQFDGRIHLKLDIIPRLEQGVTVICDRLHSASGVIYQHYDGDLPIDRVLTLSLWTKTNVAGVRDASPDALILLDVAPEKAAERRGRRSDEANHWDNDKIEQQRKRREAYLHEADREGWVVVDANQEVEDVFRDIIFELEDRGILPSLVLFNPEEELEK